MVVTPSGMVTDVTAFAPASIPDKIRVVPASNTTVSTELPAKGPFVAEEATDVFKVVSVLGMEIEVTPVQPESMLAPSVLMEDGRVSEVSNVQF